MGMVYLAGPIDAVTSEEAKDWRTEVADKLVNMGYSTFSPAHAIMWDGDAVSALRIMKINWKALEQSDIVLVHLPPGVTTIGTIRELQKAVDLGKKVLVVTPIVEHAYLCDVQVFSSFQSALDTLSIRSHIQ